ncbi:MAG TPA: cytochrome c [Methylothermaceae bacterium]|nr:cytochrome c [Methylothermaceae bacterium]
MRIKPLLPFLAALLLAGCATQPRPEGDGHLHAHSASGPAVHAPHRHDVWLTPPTEYAGLRSDHWADLQAIAKGESIYRQHCQSCHGPGGRGDGPLAADLPHPPADLTHHFHLAPGKGDGYLFWRVSEGGMVEPFRSQGSMMPAFKTILTENERWAVLAYIHAYFHLGLADWKSANVANQDSGTMERHHSEWRKTP